MRLMTIALAMVLAPAAQESQDAKERAAMVAMKKPGSRVAFVVDAKSTGRVIGLEAC